jgi:hypothetical protein
MKEEIKEWGGGGKIVKIALDCQIVMKNESSLEQKG